MTTDHNELRALALAATPGPWRVGRGSKSRVYAPYHVQPDGHAIARTYGSELNGIGVADLTGPVNIADAAYIAAANPATVLALLDEVEAAHAARREAQTRVAELTEKVQALGRKLHRHKLDTARLDWLADPGNTIGNVQLPTECVERNLHSLRAAIDDAMGGNHD